MKLVNTINPALNSFLSDEKEFYGNSFRSEYTTKSQRSDMLTDALLDACAKIGANGYSIDEFKITTDAGEVVIESLGAQIRNLGGNRRAAQLLSTYNF